MERVRNVAPARKRVNCFCERDEVREEIIELDSGALEVTVVAEAEELVRSGSRVGSRVSSDIV